MAITVYRRSAGVGRFSRGRSRPMSDINVTPMVDVMLVLLIIFMVTAPLLTVGVEVDLPQTKAKAIPGNDEPLTVTIKADGSIYLMDTPVTLNSLVPRLNAISGQNPNLRIFVRGDANATYGRVQEVMGEINAAGYRHLALVHRSHPMGQTKRAAKPAARTGSTTDTGSKVKQ